MGASPVPIAVQCFVVGARCHYFKAMWYTIVALCRGVPGRVRREMWGPVSVMGVSAIIPQTMEVKLANWMMMEGHQFGGQQMVDMKMWLDC